MIYTEDEPKQALARLLCTQILGLFDQHPTADSTALLKKIKLSLEAVPSTQSTSTAAPLAAAVAGVIVD